MLVLVLEISSYLIISYGKSGNILNEILNMYKSIKSCVLDNGMQSEFFESHVGLRLGENLSPLCFALYLNDMEKLFTKHKWNTLMYIDKQYNDCTMFSYMQITVINL